MAEGAPKKASSGDGSAFPLIVILLIALMMYGSGDFGGADGSLLGGINKKESETSVFVFEITPNTQEQSINDTTELSLRYENKSKRTLEDARLRVTLPAGAVFESGEREYFLGNLPPGKAGEVKLAIRMQEKEIENFAPRRISATALWSEGGDGGEALASVQAQILFTEAKQLADAKQKKNGAVLASADKVLAHSTVGLLIIGSFLFFLSWYVFSLLTRKKESRVFVREEIPQKRIETRKLDAVLPRAREFESTEMRKGAPPDNLPI